MQHLDKRGPEYQAILQKRYILSLQRRLAGWTEALYRGDGDSKYGDSKYSPSQPRVPAGSPNGGKWSGGGGAGRGSDSPSRNAPSRRPESISPPMSAAELERFNRHAPPGTPPHDLDIDPRFGLPRWYVGGGVSPTISPLDFIGGSGVARTAKVLGTTTAEEGIAAMQMLRGRASRAISNYRIQRAKNAIEDFFGEPLKPGDVRTNQAGDIYIEKGTKKFRMDIKNPGTKKGPQGNPVPEKPHFHFQKIKPNGKWKDFEKTHRFYFKD